MSVMVAMRMIVMTTTLMTDDDHHDEFDDDDAGDCGGGHSGDRCRYEGDERDDDDAAATGTILPAMHQLRCLSLPNIFFLSIIVAIAPDPNVVWKLVQVRPVSELLCLGRKASPGSSWQSLAFQRSRANAAAERPPAACSQRAHPPPVAIASSPPFESRLRERRHTSSAPASASRPRCQPCRARSLGGPGDRRGPVTWWPAITILLASSPMTGNHNLLARDR